MMGPYAAAVLVVVVAVSALVCAWLAIDLYKDGRDE